jgi:23S rRNA (cytosine1962-C5)-methyltransferase
VVAVDSSAPALERAQRNAELNGFSNIRTVNARAFDYLRDCEARGETFSTIVVDPPAFARNRGSLPAAIRGYKEINLQAMRLITPGGYILSASCSFHLSKSDFLQMLSDSAADSGRRIVLREVLGQPVDHPEILTIPETGYLKGALLQALD